MGFEASIQPAASPYQMEATKAGTRARPAGIRALAVIAHRWAGLTIALFLVVAGVTGAALPWQEQITALVTPSRLTRLSPHSPHATPIPGTRLAEIVQRRTGAFAYAPLDYDARRTVTMFVFAAPGAKQLDDDEVVVDPYTGAIRGTYRWGRLSDGPQNLVPFLFSLHYGVVAGEWGRFAFGIAALVWTIDCFVGFYLTLPPRRRRLAPLPRSTAGWWTRWRPSWRIRRQGRGYKLTFDLHRAGGLWLWPLLLVFAWSSAGQNLPQVHDPVMRMIGARTPAPLPTGTPLAHPSVGPVAAVAAAEAQLAAIAHRDGFRPGKPTALVYQPAQGAYRIQAGSGLGDGGVVTLWIGGASGRLMQFDRPTPPGAARKVDALFNRLHFAQIGGLPYRIAVSLFGLLVAGLSVTGVIIWSRKRTARMAAALHRRQRRDVLQ